MEPMPRLTLANHFASLDDPRIERTKLHPLLSIVVMATCAVIGGAESWDDIELFGESKAEWFASFLDLPHGIPSHDTFNRVFAALDPVQFRTCFQHWMQAVAGVLPAEVIALDGKTVRGSQDRVNGRQAIHMVSAWASANRLVLAQVKVDEKSNEITAIAAAVITRFADSCCSVTSPRAAATAAKARTPLPTSWKLRRRIGPSTSMFVAFAFHNARFQATAPRAVATPATTKRKRRRAHDQVERTSAARTPAMGPTIMTSCKPNIRAIVRSAPSSGLPA